MGARSRTECVVPLQTVQGQAPGRLRHWVSVPQPALPEGPRGSSESAVPAGPRGSPRPALPSPRTSDSGEWLWAGRWLQRGVGRRRAGGQEGAGGSADARRKKRTHREPRHSALADPSRYVGSLARCDRLCAFRRSGAGGAQRLSAGPDAGINPGSTEQRCTAFHKGKW